MTVPFIWMEWLQPFGTREARGAVLHVNIAMVSSESPPSMLSGHETCGRASYAARCYHLAESPSAEVHCMMSFALCRLRRKPFHCWFDGDIRPLLSFCEFKQCNLCACMYVTSTCYVSACWCATEVWQRKSIDTLSRDTELLRKPKRPGVQQGTGGFIPASKHVRASRKALYILILQNSWCRTLFCETCTGSAGFVMCNFGDCGKRIHMF